LARNAPLIMAYVHRKYILVEVVDFFYSFFYALLKRTHYI